MQKKRMFTIVWSLSVFMCMVFIGGCAEPVPYKPRTLTPPEMVNCVDTSGHIPGNKPFIIGGHCYCNPTYKMYKTWQKEGLFKKMSYQDVVALYKKEGYALSDSKKRNNCKGAAHAALGGKCLVPPTPGTPLYEKVVSGGSI